MSISFAGKVAIVNGAGGGLGRAYALELAKRGAKVVVNDLGGARDGTGTSDAAAKVVEEIEAAGGTAMANGGNVADFAQMQEMVAKAKEAWGGVHILINNAGILRDKSFAKMEMADFELVVKVHLIGSANCTKAVWETMREQNYGRILMTTSSTGLGGNFGQSNYGAAKMGLVGLARTLYLEGAKYNIRVNTLAPAAATRMTEDILPDAVFAQFGPEHVAPAVTEKRAFGSTVETPAQKCHPARISPFGELPCPFRSRIALPSSPAPVGASAGPMRWNWPAAAPKSWSTTSAVRATAPAIRTPRSRWSTRSPPRAARRCRMAARSPNMSRWSRWLPRPRRSGAASTY
jgi:NAD(P)-dependent dehydrogenase (short-subunit alcohol dehydrogenase family)